jgi:hypothetical protein
MNCSTECPLDGTPRANLRGLLNGWRSIRLPGGSTVGNEDQYGTSIGQKEYRARDD